MPLSFSCSPFHSKFVCSEGPTVLRVMPLVSSHESQPREGGRGTPLCGPPLRRSFEHGGPAVRAALAASQSGSSARCGASLVWHSRAQRHRSRRKRRAFMWGARSANGPPGLTLSPAEFRLQTVDESPAIKYVDPIPGATLHAAPETAAIRQEEPVSAVTFSSLAPVIEPVVPTPDASLDETAPASEHMAPAPYDTFAAPAPVTRYVALAPSDTDTTPESMTEYVAPAPAVHHATPAPPIEFVTPSHVIEYSAPAPSVTCFTPSPQFPFAYTMADLITGVTVDTRRSVNSQSLITDVGASASQVAGSLPPIETTNFGTEIFRHEKWNLCGAATSVDDACPRPRLCTEHFDLTADGSQDECSADGMHGCELASSLSDRNTAQSHDWPHCPSMDRR